MSLKHKINEKTSVELFLKTNNDFENDLFLNNLVNINNKLIQQKSNSFKDKNLLKNLLVDLHNYSALAIISMGEPFKKSKNEVDLVTTTNKVVENLDKEEAPIHIMYFDSKTEWDYNTSSAREHVAKYYKDETYHCTCKGFKYYDWCWHCDKLYKNHC